MTINVADSHLDYKYHYPQTQTSDGIHISGWHLCLLRLITRFFPAIIATGRSRAARQPPITSQQNNRQCNWTPRLNGMDYVVPVLKKIYLSLL